METKQVVIDVTQEDINKGVSQHCKHCPVALAIGRLLKSGFVAFVTPTSITINNDKNSGSIYSTYLPMEARAFIRSFDESMAVTPISFEVPLSLEVLA